MMTAGSTRKTHASCAGAMPILFTDTATAEIYTLSLHDALPIFIEHWSLYASNDHRHGTLRRPLCSGRRDRKSTRLNSSHGYISYAVSCLTKKRTSHSPSDAPTLRTRSSRVSCVATACAAPTTHV